MREAISSSSRFSTNKTDHEPDRSARLAEAFLLLTATATVVMAFTRVAADADQETLLESLRAVDQNRGLFSSSGAARLVSGGTYMVSTSKNPLTTLIWGHTKKTQTATPVSPLPYPASFRSL